MKKKFIICALILLFVLGIGFYLTKHTDAPNKQNYNPNTEVPSDRVKVLSVKPADNSTILPTQPIDITFDSPVQNADELKRRVEPVFDYKVTLSEDKKTATITPTQTYPLGNTITLFIQSDTKFDNGKRLDAEVVYHFNSITYRGI